MSDDKKMGKSYFELIQTRCYMVTESLANLSWHERISKNQLKITHNQACVSYFIYVKWFIIVTAYDRASDFQFQKQLFPFQPTLNSVSFLFRLSLMSS